MCIWALLVPVAFTDLALQSCLMVADIFWPQLLNLTLILVICLCPYSRWSWITMQTAEGFFCLDIAKALWCKQRAYYKAYKFYTSIYTLGPFVTVQAFCLSSWILLQKPFYLGKNSGFQQMSFDGIESWIELVFKVWSCCIWGSEAVGSGPRYQILLHVFARCTSQKTHGHAIIARVSRACPCVSD